MGYTDDFSNLTIFEGLPVEDYDNAKGLANVGTHAYRVSASWEDDDLYATFLERLKALVTTPEASQLKALVIGNWAEAGQDPSEIIDCLLDHVGNLTSLRALFFGDVAQEECEVSWMEQGNQGRLLSAFENLETLIVRGGKGLSFDGAKNSSLKTLVVQSGGLPKEALASLAASHLPAVRHLELWLGVDEYGFDGGLESVKPYIDGKVFPALRYLGLRNSEIVDEIAEALHGSPRFDMLAELDLSLGTMTDEGATALLSNEGVQKLTRLDLHHHFISDAMVEKLKALDVDVDLSDVQEADEYGGEVYRYPAVTE